jgi:hypothetical protein
MGHCLVDVLEDILTHRRSQKPKKKLEEALFIFLILVAL